MSNVYTLILSDVHNILPRILEVRCKVKFQFEEQCKETILPFHQVTESEMSKLLCTLGCLNIELLERFQSPKPIPLPLLMTGTSGNVIYVKSAQTTPLHKRAEWRLPSPYLGGYSPISGIELA